LLLRQFHGIYDLLVFSVLHFIQEILSAVKYANAASYEIVFVAGYAEQGARVTGLAILRSSC
jgi:uncharacterized Tic20 family protein